MTPQPRYQPGDRIGGRYQVHKALMGGMGEVYLCLDLETNYPYALKTFQQRYLIDAQRLRKAFEQEVATWVALEKHPNIVRCFEMRTLDRQPFMVLEWIVGEEGRGTDLRGWLRRGPLDLKLALEIAIDICQGLRHAQMKRPGLVHRDLKPDNILIAQGGLAKITDFGLAEIAQSAGLELAVGDFGVTRRQSLVGEKGIAGTPAYMAPEQWRGEPLDVRTDIYALGCILYELLTGDSPFPVTVPATTPNRDAIWLRTLQQAHEQASVAPLPSPLPAALNDLVQRALAKAPSARYVDIADLLSDLTSVYQVAFNQPPRVQPVLDAFTATDYNNRGLTYHELGQREAALADYTQAIFLEPQDATAYNNRGVTYHELGQREQALADYTHALALDSTLAQVYANQGVTYAALGQRETALADFTQAIALDPTYAKAYSNRGMTYHELEQWEAALADFTHAITLDPALAQVYANRGNTYRALGQREAALADYTHALALDPHYAEVYHNRGNTYRVLGQREAALADYTHALALDPHYAKAYFNRGGTYGALGQREAALADFTQAIALDPTYAKAYFNRGAIYDGLGQREAALADYTHALDLDPQDARAYYNRGVTYHQLGQGEAALVDYTHALALDPALTQAYLNIGALLGDQGQLAEALPYLEKAAQLGHPQAAQYAAGLRRILRMKPEESSSDPVQAAFAAFQQTDSVETMQQSVTRFPLLLHPDFIATLEQTIAQQVPPEHRPAFTQRLTWLRQIASTQRSTP